MATGDKRRKILLPVEAFAYASAARGSDGAKQQQGLNNETVRARL